jgi:glycosyltransferase involved in cell wall biosynthesis
LITLNEDLKKAIISVINDLVTDQRVDRTARTLVEMGFNVLLVGRKLKKSLPIIEKPYKTKRMFLLFSKGPLFYAEYNIRLFLFLLFHKSNLLVSNDLDTLLPNFLIHKIKRIPIVYDSHEYFTGVPELENRRIIQKIWKSIEKRIFPKLKVIITVNNSIAELYKKEYDKQLIVVRNIPLTKKGTVVKTKKELGLPEDKNIILLQGAGINIDRGAEEAVMAMEYIENAILFIIGGGDVIPELKLLVEKLFLSEKVNFLPKQTPEMLFNYTCHAKIGLTLDKDTNINYRFSLPNKLFDYIHAGIPILSSKLVEIQKIIDQYQIGETIDNHNPRHISDKINSLFQNQEKLEFWKKNLIIAQKELCWENEKKVLIKTYEPFI